MDRLRAIIEKKPLSFIIVTLGYLILLIFLKWRLHPDVMSLIFLLGGIVGIYFLDAAEEFFRLDPSPFRTIFFQALFALVALFVVTSSGSHLAMGLVLSIFLTLVLRLVGEWRVRGSIGSWLQPRPGQWPVSSERRLLALFILTFVLETVIFIR